LSIGAGVSSSESLIGEVSIRERNLLGKGQDLRLSLAASGRRQQIDLGFTEPYFLDRPLAAGFDLFHRKVDYKESSFSQGSSGVNLRAVFPITEYLSMGVRYQFRYDTVTDRNNLVESVYIDEGSFNTSSIGYTLAYDVRDDRIKPTRGFNIVFS